MPEEGFEPTWNRMSRWILSPVRLPISPLRLASFLSFSKISVNIKEKGMYSVVVSKKNSYKEKKAGVHFRDKSRHLLYPLDKNMMS